MGVCVRARTRACVCVIISHISVTAAYNRAVFSVQHVARYSQAEWSCQTQRQLSMDSQTLNNTSCCHENLHI